MQYYKWTDKGELILVDEERGRFMYITPGPREREKELRYENLSQVFDSLEDRLKQNTWTSYNRDIVIKV